MACAFVDKVTMHFVLMKFTLLAAPLALAQISVKSTAVATPTATASAAPPVPTASATSNEIGQCVKDKCEKLQGQEFVNCSASCAGTPFPTADQVTKTGECEAKCTGTGPQLEKCKMDCWKTFYMPGSEKQDTANAKGKDRSDGKTDKTKSDAGSVSFVSGIVIASFVVGMVQLL